MHKGPEHFSRIYFGFDLEQFYLRLDPLADPPPALPGDLEIQVRFIEPTPAKLVFRIGVPDPPQYALWLSQDGTAFSLVRTCDRIRRKKVIELALPFKDLKVNPGARVHLVIKVMQGDLELERYPQDRPLAFTVPDHTFEATMWKA
jgi:hypothetical protein